MRKFTAVDVKAIIEADRAGKIHLEPRDYTDETLAAAIEQYRALPLVGTDAHPGYQHAWGKNDLCIYKGCKAGPAELEAAKAARAQAAEMEQPAPAEWSGSQCPIDPDGCWIDDETEEHVNAKTAYRTAGHPVTA